MMTSEELQEIKYRSEHVCLAKSWAFGNIGPNQWVVFLDSDEHGKLSRYPAQRLAKKQTPGFVLDCYAMPDVAEFIAHARTDVPRLISEIERLKGLLKND